MISDHAPLCSPVDSTTHLEGTARGFQTFCMLRFLKYSREMSVGLCSMVKPHQRGGTKPRSRVRPSCTQVSEAAWPKRG